MPDTARKHDLPLGEPQALIKRFEDMNREGVKRRKMADSQARLNLAFYRAYQYVEPGRSDASVLTRIERPDDEDAPIMLTINKIGEKVNRLVPKVYKGDVQPECRPRSDEDDDVGASLVGTQILASEYDRMHMQTLKIRTGFAVVPAGWGFWHQYWDGDAGELVDIDDDGTPVYEGEICTEFCWHSEITYADCPFYDPRKTRWAIRTIALHPDEVWERYGKEVEEPLPARTIEDELANLWEPGADHGAKGVAVRQMWIRPGGLRAVPEGLCITWAGSTILEAAKPWPYKRQKHLPFVQVNYLSPQGSSWGRSPVSDGIEPQMDYNDARSILADYRKRLIPHTYGWKGGVDTDMLDGSLQYVEVNPVVPELPRTDVPSPAWMEPHMATIKLADQELSDMMHVSDSNTGGLAGTSPAAGVFALSEAASEPLAVPAMELAEAMSEHGHQILMLVREFWDDDRLIRTWSRAGQLEVKRFRAADLEGEFDVHVSIESVLPRSKAGRSELALQMLDRQMIGPRRFLQMIEAPVSDVLTQSFAAHERKAERENARMAVDGLKIPVDGAADEQGQAAFHSAIAKALPLVAEEDNDEVHLEVHEDHMVGPEFERYPAKVQALFRQHAAWHRQMIASRMQGGVGGSPDTASTGGPVQTDGSQQPVNPVLAAAGMQPQPEVPPRTDAAANPPDLENLASIGGVGNPGPVPGVSPDAQAALMGR